MTEAGDPQGTGHLEKCLERHRPLVSAAAAFVIGTVAARCLTLPFWTAAGLGAASLVGFLLLRRRLGERVQTLLVFVLIAAAGAANYAFQADAARHRGATSLARRLDTEPTLCAITGTVRGETTVARICPVLEAGRGGTRQSSTIRVRTTQLESNGQAVDTSGDVHVVVNGELTEVGHGDRVRVFGWLVPLRPHRASDRYAASKGLVARMSVADPGAVIINERGPGTFPTLLYAVKGAFRRHIDAHFSGEAPATLKAILLGDRERLGRDHAGTFEKSGTMHVLSISGLHVGIVYLAVLWLCRMLLIQRWPRRLIILSVVMAYAITTGFRPATIRATLMIVLFEAGVALKYYRDPVNAVAGAALAILAVAPEHLFEAGFQLTFVAVLGILVFAQDIARLLGGQPDELERLVEPEFESRTRRVARRARRTVGGVLGVCAAATLSVTPLQAYYFHMVTPVSVLATAVLFPIVVVLIALGFVFLAVASVAPPLAGVLAAGLSWVAAVFNGAVELAARVPFGHAFVAPPSPGWIWLAYGSLLVVAGRRWLGLRGTRAVLAPVGLLCVYLACRAWAAPGPEPTATFVDVGHGASVILTRGRRTIIYDCGSGTPSSTYDVGRGPVATELWRMGVKHIDVLFLSHTDADHVNGVLSLIDRFPVGTIIVNHSFAGDDPDFRKDEIGAMLWAEFEARGIRRLEAGAGDRVALPGFQIEVLWPPKTAGPWKLGQVNDRSLVLRVTSGERSLLLTGDIEEAGMGALLATQDDLAAEVLYVPHHGADERGLPEFVAAVRSTHAVISGQAGDPEQRKNVAKLFTGVRLYQTFRDGTIRLTGTADGWRARTSRSGPP